MRVVFWTHQARSDLAAIRTFISQDSPHYASIVVAQLIAATDRLITFPESGRAVPEFTARSFVKSFIDRTGSSIGSWALTRFMSSRSITDLNDFLQISNSAAQHALEPVRSSAAAGERWTLDL